MSSTILGSVRGSESAVASFSVSKLTAVGSIAACIVAGALFAVVAFVAASSDSSSPPASEPLSTLLVVTLVGAAGDDTTVVGAVVSLSSPTTWSKNGKIIFRPTVFKNCLVGDGSSCSFPLYILLIFGSMVVDASSDQQSLIVLLVVCCE